MKREKRKNSKLGYAILIIVLIIVTGISDPIGIMLGNEIFNKWFNTDSKSEIISSTGLTQDHKDSFVNSCIQSGGTQEYCNCAFDYMKDKITPEDFKNYYEEYQATKQIPLVFRNAQTVCTR